MTTTPNDLGTRAAAGLAWVFAASGTQTILKLAFLTILARLLVPEEFALVAVATMVITFLVSLASLGVAPAIVQHPSLAPAHLNAGFQIAVLLGALISLFLVGAATMVEQFFQMEGVARLVRLLALVPLIEGCSQVSEAMLQRSLRFKELALIESGSHAVSGLAVSLPLACLGFGAQAIAAGMIASATFKSCAQFLLQRPYIGMSVQLAAWREVLRFGTGFSLAQFAHAIAYNIDNLVIGKWMGAEALGLYSRAFQVLSMPTKLFGRALLNVLFPAMAAVQDDSQRLSRALLSALGLTCMLGMNASAFLGVLAPELVELILGPRWEAVVLPFQVLSLAIVVRIGHKICDAVIRAKGAVYGLAWRQCLYGAAVFLGAYSGHFYGLHMAALGVVLAISLNSFIMLAFALQLSATRWSDLGRKALRHLLVSLAVALLLWAVVTPLRLQHVAAPLVLITAVTVGGAALLALLRFATGVFGEEAALAIEMATRIHRQRKTRRQATPLTDHRHHDMRPAAPATEPCPATGTPVPGLAATSQSRGGT